MMGALAMIAAVVLAIVVVAAVLAPAERGRDMATAGQTWYSEEDAIGCRAREDLVRLGQLGRQNDRGAAATLLFSKASEGQCRIVKSGLPLYVETADISGFPCMRPQGDPFCLYIAERLLHRLQ